MKYKSSYSISGKFTVLEVEALDERSNIDKNIRHDEYGHSIRLSKLITEGCSSEDFGSVLVVDESRKCLEITTEKAFFKLFKEA